MSPPPLSPQELNNLKKAIEQEFLKATNGFEDICFRSARHEYVAKYSDLKEILETKYSIVGGRYNPPGIAILYLSCDEYTCLAERTYARKQATIPESKFFPLTIFAIKVRLTKILDLTDGDVCLALGVLESDLTDEDNNTNWFAIQDSGKEALTQSIGRLAKEVGFEGLLVPSARFDGKNLNLFYPDNIPPSSVEVVT